MLPWGTGLPANVLGGSGEAARGTWCTPRWLADIIGPVDLDPCSNPRSHIRAGHRLCLEEGANGLLEEVSGRFRTPSGGVVRANANWRTFINPPYGHGQVIRWVRHYRHTRFVYLLRWDPSTAWFPEILRASTHVWFPSRRINFEPPPGVRSSSNAYPHALYLRAPPPDLVSRLSRSGFLFPVDGHRVAMLSTAHDAEGGSGSHTSGAGHEAAGGAGRGGDRAGADGDGAIGAGEVPAWASLRFLGAGRSAGTASPGAAETDVRGAQGAGAATR